MQNNPNRESAIQSLQLQHLLSISNVSLFVSVLLACILVYVQREVIATPALLAWCAISVAAFLARAAVILFCQRTPAKDRSATNDRLVGFRAVILASSLAWGSAGFLMFPANDALHQMFLIFMLAGLTAGGVTSFAADLTALIVFSVTVILPLIIRLFIAGDTLSTAMGTAVTLYLGFMIASSIRINRNLMENFVLRLDAVAREETLRKTAIKMELFRFAIDKCTLPLYWVSPEGQIFDVNDTACTQLGYSREELVNKYIWDIDPDYKPEDRPSAWATLKAQKISTFERRQRRKDGTLFPVEATANYISYEGREFVFTFAPNITERKRAETDLRIAAAAFESQQPIIITDSKSIIQRVNKAFTDSTGYAPEEVVGQTPRLLKSGLHDANFYRAMWESVTQNGIWQGEIWDKRKNGEIYPKWLTISAVKDDYGVVTHYVGTHLDITERKAAEEKIRELAFLDPLTHLPNRQLLLDRLHHALASSSRNGRKGALLFIDLDNFKTLNDTLGHAMGDMLLQQVAGRLAASVRETDTVARLGGDEFVVMLEDLSGQTDEAAEQVEVMGEKILAIVSEDYQLDAQKYRITTSIGATLFVDHIQDTEELLKQADIAMYQAKKAGRNILRFFDSKMQDTINMRVALEGELRKALDNRQFQLYYQAQVNGAGSVVGAEVLLRWIHPERGMVSPAQFIPLAEETGLILPIGLWVLDTACAQLNDWARDEPARNFIISVNISARQFHQECFVDQVRAAVNRHAVKPELLKLELTESLLLENTDETIATMKALKAIGVQLSLDDFGTGYSSLQYLKLLPLDQIKIDQSFVRDIATDANDAAIVQTIIAMTRTLGLDVIAEGVETEEQLEFLKLRGCKSFQGYLFGKPAPIEQFDVAHMQ